MVLPSSLAVNVAKVQVSTNDFKLQPNVDIVSSSGIVTVSLPSNGIFSMDSFYKHVELTPTFTGGGAVRVNRFAPLWSKVIVDLNGQTLNATSHLPELWTALNQLSSTNDRRNRQNIYESGDPQAVATGVSVKLLVQEFPGTFIGTASQRLLDLSTLPDIKLHFYTATPAQVLCISSGIVTGADYQLSKVFASYKSFSVDDGGAFYAETQRFLSVSGNKKMIAYDNWLSTINQKGVVGTTSIDLQANSIDKAMVLPLVAQNTLSAYNDVSKTSSCYDRAVNPANYNWQFTMAGFQYPMYQGDVATAYALASHNLEQKYANKGGFDPLMSNAGQWASPFFTASVSFTLDNAHEAGGHWISGINTLDSCQRLSFTSSGTDATTPATSDLLFVKTTSILNIYGDKDIRVVP